MNTPTVLYAHFHPSVGHPFGEDAYGRLLDVLLDVTPVVQPLPPDAALLDVRGAMRYFARNAQELAALIRVRVLARYGTDCTVGVAANPMLARMVAWDGLPGCVRVLPDDPASVAEFLAGKPPIALPGVGPATAATLGTYGLDRIDRIAAAPLGTLQRILGATQGRQVHERARGIDPGPVVPGRPPRTVSAERRFGRDELDVTAHRRALMALAEQLGGGLRTQEQAAESLTLTVRYADRSTTVRSRNLPEVTAHSAVLVACAYRLYGALGLQRARVRAVALRAEGVRPADGVARQLSLDPGDDRARRLEAATDRARARFGPDALGPAVLYGNG